MSEERYKTEEYNGHKVEFYDKYEVVPNEYKEHVYLVDGFEKPSVTQILEQQGIATSYPDTLIVQQAAKRGTFIHAECEKVMLDDSYVPLSIEAQFVKTVIKPMLLNPKCETLLFTEKYAGQCDLFGLTEDNTVILIDYKTGGWDREIVSWQLTMYYYGLINIGLINPKQTVQFFVADLKDDLNKCKLVQIDPVVFDEYKKLYDCIGTEKTYEKPFFTLKVDGLPTLTTKEELEGFFAVLDKLDETLQYAIGKKLASVVKKIDEGIKAQMLESKMTVGKTPDGCTWELSTFERADLDKSLMKKKAPKIYQRYLKTSTNYRLNFKGHPVLNELEKKAKEQQLEAGECKHD